MPKTELVNLYVEPSTKEEWTEYVEESDSATSVSHLIRQSVNRQIAGLYEPSGSTDTSSTGTGTVELPEDLSTQLDRIEDSLGNLNNRVRSLEDRPSEALEESRAEIFASLPTYPNPAEMDVVEENAEGEWIFTESNEYGITLDEIASRTDRHRREIASAVLDLLEVTDEIAKVASDENEYFWRKE